MKQNKNTLKKIYDFADYNICNAFFDGRPLIPMTAKMRLLKIQECCLDNTLPDDWYKALKGKHNRDSFYDAFLKLFDGVPTNMTDVQTEETRKFNMSLKLGEDDSSAIDVMNSLMRKYRGCDDFDHEIRKCAEKILKKLNKK